MKVIKFVQLFLYILFVKVNYANKANANNKKSLPQFRRHVEEIEDLEFFKETTAQQVMKDNLYDNFMSILVNNAKEIFNNEIEKSEPPQTELITTIEPLITTKPMSSIETSDFSPKKSTPTVTAVAVESPSEETVTHESASITSTATISTTCPEVTDYKNMTMINDNENYVSKQLYAENMPFEVSTQEQQLTTDEIDKNSNDTEDRPVIILPRAYANIEPTQEEFLKRSCIVCNNVDSEECNEPRNKIKFSRKCERDDDMCYSMHTPFGIVDRGCFNPNKNITTYVCACNLCNHISISDMPVMFNDKHQWINNVIEISHTRRFRKSVYKNMSCLRCEVNVTTEENLQQSANCLEGNVANLPAERCDENEVCAVRALRSEGYIWRGCVKAPLYNYWWGLCNYDLCNCEPLLSLYDFVQ